MLKLDNDTTQWCRPNAGWAGMTQGQAEWRQDEHKQELAQRCAEWRQVVQDMDGTIWGRNGAISCDSDCLYERNQGIEVEGFPLRSHSCFHHFQITVFSCITNILLSLACEQAIRGRTISTPQSLFPSPTERTTLTVPQHWNHNNYCTGCQPTIYHLPLPDRHVWAASGSICIRRYLLNVIYTHKLDEQTIGWYWWMGEEISKIWREAMIEIFSPGCNSYPHVYRISLINNSEEPMNGRGDIQHLAWKQW